MDIDFLKPILGEELFAQVSAKLEGATDIMLANIAGGRYVPKDKFDESRTRATGLQKQVADLTAQLDAAQKSAGNAEALSAQVAKLTQDIAERDKQISQRDTDYAIKDALRAARARDVDIVFGLLQRDKIARGEDGALTGVDEQVKALRESKGFLFDEEKPAARGGYGGRQDTLDGTPDSKNAAANNAIRAMAGR